MTTEYTADRGYIDEDGYRTVVVYADGEEVDRQTLRADIAGQWLAQELAILQRMADARGALCEHGLDAGLCEGPQHYPREAR